MNDPARQIAELASSLEATVIGVQTEVHSFPAGGVMLDVRLHDHRVYVMSYAPKQGFGVDEARSDDGFTTDYRYTYLDFEPAADQLRRLVFPALHRD